VGYGELLRALSAEATRDAARLRETAARAAERVLDSARSAVVAEREAALAAAAATERATLARARAQAARQVEAAVLGEARRQLDRLRADALVALRERGAALEARLVDELCARAEAGPGVLVVDPGREATVRQHLSLAYPDLAQRLEVCAAAAPRGGAELRQGDVVLDDTLEARLERAWPGIEPQLAALLFGTAGAGRGAE
jgi:vacuolar-type H+-ATPase subunit E/Vma4